MATVKIRFGDAKQLECMILSTTIFYERATLGSHERPRELFPKLLACQSSQHQCWCVHLISNISKLIMLLIQFSHTIFNIEGYQVIERPKEETNGQQLYNLTINRFTINNVSTSQHNHGTIPYLLQFLHMMIIWTSITECQTHISATFQILSLHGLIQINFWNSSCNNLTFANHCLCYHARLFIIGCIFCPFQIIMSIAISKNIGQIIWRFCLQ